MNIIQSDPIGANPNNTSQENPFPEQELPFDSLAYTLKQYEYSIPFNLFLLIIPGIKIILALLLALSGDTYAMLLTTTLSKIFLFLLICHDVLHLYIILEKIFVGVDMKYLQSINDQEEPQSDLRTQEELPLSTNDHQQQRPLAGLEFQKNLLTMSIPKKKKEISNLMKGCWAIWTMLFIMFILMGGMSQFELHVLEFTWTSFPVSFFGSLVSVVSIFDVQHDLFFFSIPLLIFLFVEKFAYSTRRRRPAMHNIIADLPVKEYSEDLPGNNECAICLVDYEIAEKIIQLGCNDMHHFHEGCLKDWLKINGQCPVCRKKVEKPKNKRRWKFF